MLLVLQAPIAHGLNITHWQPNRRLIYSYCSIRKPVLVLLLIGLLCVADVGKAVKTLNLVQGLGFKCRRHNMSIGIW